MLLLSIVILLGLVTGAAGGVLVQRWFEANCTYQHALEAEHHECSTQSCRHDRRLYVHRNCPLAVLPDERTPMLSSTNTMASTPALLAIKERLEHRRTILEKQ